MRKRTTKLCEWCHILITAILSLCCWSTLSLRCNKLLQSKGHLRDLTTGVRGGGELEGVTQLLFIDQLNLWQSGSMPLVWPDYFSELVALRTSAAHWTGLLGAAGCSCTIYTSIRKGGDRQSRTLPLLIPSLISPFSLSRSFDINYFWKERKVSPRLPPSGLLF